MSTRFGKISPTMVIVLVVAIILAIAVIVVGGFILKGVALVLEILFWIILILATLGVVVWRFRRRR